MLKDPSLDYSALVQIPEQQPAMGNCGRRNQGPFYRIPRAVKVLPLKPGVGQNRDTTASVVVSLVRIIIAVHDSQANRNLSLSN